MGPGFGHGTAGNGSAFLRLFARTGDELRLERARSFGMHAAAQVGRNRERPGRGRFSLWTGDPGTALYLQAATPPTWRAVLRPLLSGCRRAGAASLH